MRIGLVEDEHRTARALIDGLSSYRHSVEWMRRGADLLDRFDRLDAVLLDLGLPYGETGLDVLRNLRARSDLPVVILTSRGDDATVVTCLHSGADDYIVKPVRIQVLDARLTAAVRKHRGAARPEVIVLDDIAVQHRSRKVEVAGRDIGLTKKEYELVLALVDPPGAAVPYDRLIDRLWPGDPADRAQQRKRLFVLMTEVKKKLDRPGSIATIRGYGYRWGS